MSKCLHERLFLASEMRHQYPYVSRETIFDIMFGLGLTEILILTIVLLLFFGPFKINDVTRSIGQGLRKFKEAKNEIDLTESPKLKKQDRDPVDKS